MGGVERNLGASRRSQATQWAVGALRALAAIGLSALLVWLAVAAITASGLLHRPQPPPEPPGGGLYPQSAYG